MMSRTRCAPGPLPQAARRRDEDHSIAQLPPVAPGVTR